jgi:HlyD family secretion protein
VGVDIARPERLIARRRRQMTLAAVALVVLTLTGFGLARLQPAAPAVERATLWIDTVKRGEMRREVRGIGTLVPEEIRWIPAAAEARVERIVLQPGTPVKADDVVLELSNPELELRAAEAESQRRQEEASLAELKVRLESGRLDQKAAAARVQAEYQQARLRADADAELARQGLIADLTLKLSQNAAGELEHRHGIEQERLRIAAESIQAQLAVQAARVEQARAQARLRRAQFEALRVRAGIDGVLQMVPVEVGQRVTPGANLARVARPDRLKAVVRVPETQAKDVLIGQKATVDTRNGVVEARVARVDPAVQNGTVTVDLALAGALPKGARPDLSVDGTIELERLTNVLYVGRPAHGQSEGLVGLFRLGPDGANAARVQVQLGRGSVSTIEVVRGLQEGDQVILSDTATWDAYDRLRIH